MPQRGQILVNPVSGDSYEFLETADDTNGERISIKMVLKTKGLLVPNHFHVLQDETFEVLEGKLTIWLKNTIHILNSGDTMTLPKGKPHNHYNDSDETLTMIQTVTPALDFEYLMENLIGLASDGLMKNGKASIFQELVTLKYLDSKSFLADVPVGVQKVLMNTVAPISRMFGYRAVYKKYSGFEK